MITSEEDDDAMDEIEALIVVLAKKMKRNKTTKQPTGSILSQPEQVKMNQAVKLGFCHENSSTPNFSLTELPSTLSELIKQAQAARYAWLSSDHGSYTPTQQIDFLKFNGQRLTDPLSQYKFKDGDIINYTKKSL